MLRDTKCLVWNSKVLDISLILSLQLITNIACYLVTGWCFVPMVTHNNIHYYNESTILLYSSNFLFCGYEIINNT